MSKSLWGRPGHPYVCRSDCLGPRERQNVLRMQDDFESMQMSPNEGGDAPKYSQCQPAGCGGGVCLEGTSPPKGQGRQL